MKKASIISDNKRIDKPVDKPVQHIDKEEKSVEEGEVVPLPSQVCNFHDFILNVGTKRLIIEKQSYATVAT